MVLFIGKKRYFVRFPKRYLKILVVYSAIIYLSLGSLAPVYAEEAGKILNDATASASSDNTISGLSFPFNGQYSVSRNFGDKGDELVLSGGDLKQATDSATISEKSSELVFLEGDAGHNGMDFETPEGTEVLAVSDGEVVEAGDGDYGITIVIKHSWGESVYGHLKEVSTEVGKKVLKGEKIGLSGNTGFTTGPHLHLGIKDNEGNWQNPAQYLGVNTAVLGESTQKVGYKDTSQDPEYAYRYVYELANHTTVHFSNKRDSRPGYAISDPTNKNKLRFFLEGNELASSSAVIKDNVVEYPVEVGGVPMTLRYTVLGDRIKEEFVIAQNPNLDHDLSISFETSDEGLSNTKKDSEYIFRAEDKNASGAATVDWKIAEPEVSDAKGHDGDIEGKLVEKAAESKSADQNSNYALNISKDFLKNASYPVTIDPTVIVSGGIVNSDTQFGGLQTKTTNVNGAWYAFYNQSGKVYYKKSADGTTWASAVDMDSTDSDNYNPSIWTEGNYIYVTWIDISSGSVEFNRIDTSSSDDLGTKCIGSYQGSLSDTFTSSISVADDGTVYVAFSDTSSDSETGVLKFDYSTCATYDGNSGVYVFPSQGVSQAYSNSNAAGPNPILYWKDIETSEGVYDWSALDAYLDAAAAAGKKAIPRIVANYDSGQVSPDWFFTAAGSEYYQPSGSAKQPVPWGPVFKAKFGAFLTALGQRYDGDSRIELFQTIAGGGLYGEMVLCVSACSAGTTLPSDYSVANVKAGIAYWVDAWRDAFPNTALTLMVNDLGSNIANDSMALASPLNYAFEVNSPTGLSGTITTLLSTYDDTNKILVEAENGGCQDQTMPDFETMLDTTFGYGFSIDYLTVCNSAFADATTSSFIGSDILTTGQTTSLRQTISPSYMTNITSSDPITETLLVNGSDTVDRTSYTSNSFTPSANKLILATVVSAGTAPVPTLSGNGLTWVQVNTQLHTTSSHRVTVFRAMGSSPTTGTLTMTFGASAQAFAAWTVSEFGNVDTSGTNGSGAVVQSNIAATTGASSLSVSLSAFGSVNNATYGAFDLNANSSFSINPGSGFTEIDEVKTQDQVETEWRSGNDTTVDASFTVSSSAGGVGLEIKAAPTGPGLTAGDRPVLTTTGNNLHLVFQDGELSYSKYDGSSWTTINSTIASVTDNLYSLTTDNTNLWLLSLSGSTATNFYKYNGSSWSTSTAPWSGQTNLTSLSLTYDSSNSDLYAFSIKDTDEQGYYKMTDASTISWGSDTSLNFTSGNLGNISSPMVAADETAVGAVARQGSNFEFYPLNEPTPTPTSSPTPTESPTPTPTNSPTPTESPTPTVSPTPIPNPSTGGGSLPSISVGVSCTGVPPSIAPNIYETVTNSNGSVTLYFTSSGGPFDHYTLIYGTEPGVYQFGNLYIGSQETRTFTVNDLQPGVTYYFKVAGVNGCVVGVWSNEVKSAGGNSSQDNLNIQTTDTTVIPESVAPSNTPVPTISVPSAQKKITVNNQNNSGNEKVVEKKANSVWDLIINFFKSIL